MIRKHIESLLNLEHELRLLIFDCYGFFSSYNYISLLKEYDFDIHYYLNVEEFRILYEELLKENKNKIAVIVKRNIYVPYDIRQSFRCVDLSLYAIFPKLNGSVLEDYMRDLELISYSYDKCYSDSTTPAQTDKFIKEEVFTKQTVQKYCKDKSAELSEKCLVDSNYIDWLNIAKEVALVRYYAAKFDVPVDLSSVDDEFKQFIYENYDKVSLEINQDYPLIVTKTLDIICKSNEKIALIVMDGMSLVDFETISRHFDGIKYESNCSFAIIPTTTAISRQSLLLGEYPRVLDKPFSGINEENEFKLALSKRDYIDNQIMYSREYESDISQFTKFIAVIINDIDDIVHGQKQGREGMFNNMNTLGKSGKLQNLIRQLYKQGFTVYITSDHGNTLCTGVGSFRSGIEVETRSKRMVVLKNFAEANDLMEMNTTEYPGYYLDQSYKYYICNNGVSFDNKGDMVMTHGGISLDEVIVPFIKITEVD